MVKSKRGVLRIGTSGIVVPGNKQTIPFEFQHKTRLNYYSSYFNSLEVNSTFKKLPRATTFEKWASEVDDNFEFTIKAWKEITHAKKLDVELSNIGVFFEAVNNIGNKKGCLLIQFPGSITIDYKNTVEQIVSKFNELNSNGQWKIAVEFRNISWYNETVLNMLRHFKVAIVQHDMPKSQSLELLNDSSFFYIRLHGPVGDYRGSYSTTFLETLSQKITGFLNEGKDVYLYFNNTMGDAFQNAITIKRMVG